MFSIFALDMAITFQKPERKFLRQFQMFYFTLFLHLSQFNDNNTD